MTFIRFALEQLDRSRRLTGLGYDAFGFGVRPTASQKAFCTHGVTLLTYPEQNPDGPVLVLVPAPIKRSYIWDLAPDYSVVRQALRAGFRVYLMAWHRPGPLEQDFGLEVYADRLIRECLDYIAEATGQRQVFLAGHSLGGVFTAIFSALYPDRVRGLVLLEAPIEFERHGGPLKALVDGSPPTTAMTRMLGNVPGVYLSTSSALGVPESFVGERLLDWWCSSLSPDTTERHMRVVRWTLDEVPLARRLVEQINEDLYRRNLFFRNQLTVDGQPALPVNVFAPVLSVVDPKSRVIPPQSALQFHDVISSQERRALYYSGDTGVAMQHVGILVGRNAHDNIWPAILEWLHAQAGSGRSEK